jgi:hypothetical protein
VKVLDLHRHLLPGQAVLSQAQGFHDPVRLEKFPAEGGVLHASQKAHEHFLAGGIDRIGIDAHPRFLGVRAEDRPEGHSQVPDLERGQGLVRL